MNSEIPLFFAAILAFFCFLLFMAICDPNKEEREQKEQQRIEQLNKQELEKQEKTKWLNDNCEIKKETNCEIGPCGFFGFVKRTVYKCNDGSKRVIYD